MRAQRWDETAEVCSSGSDPAGFIGNVQGTHGSLNAPRSSSVCADCDTDVSSSGESARLWTACIKREINSDAELLLIHSESF